MRRIALLVVLLTACAENTETKAQTAEAGGELEKSPAQQVRQTTRLAPDEVTYAPELGVDLEAMTLRESGLYVQVLEDGEGPEAAPGDILGVDYTVWLIDGTRLDSSFDHEPAEPLTMVLGRTRLIDGWTEGVTGMRLGEKRRLVVPYQLAYGERGRPPKLPPYSTLVFELELAEHSPDAE